MDSGQTRQRMRPWLESKVESGQIPGLAWIDREKKIFRVPWKHGGKHDWNEADSTIFKVEGCFSNDVYCHLLVKVF